ncbi:MAG: sigma-54-dependent Fis family transcriptional regulator [Planctomycetota bacterium]|nr:MAG: sigma-54-dependent Fis family transcriptional regulator [Planctomycetota bacterium]
MRVLFVDDEAALRAIIAEQLPALGHQVVVCADGTEALKELQQGAFDIAIVDLRMPGLSGWDVAEHIRRYAPDTDIVIHTAHGDVDSVVRALRMRVFDFLPKPCDFVELEHLLARCTEKRRLQNRLLALESELQAVRGRTLLVGETPVMCQVRQLIERVAPTDCNVLIQGETGTGKELAARLIHELSERRDQPFVPVNCGAIAENLVESELFGHARGAFTGAEAARKGLLEVAHGGTLFLDELGELDKAMQVKLLRFLESGEIRRVGDNKAFHVDVRVVCATNRDLKQMVEQGQFREDLFFRINTFVIQLPPLRLRTDDIQRLAEHLLKRGSGRRNYELTPEALDCLRRYHWPGNVRELANVLEHARILSRDGCIRAEDLPNWLTGHTADSNAIDDAFKQWLDAQPRTLKDIERFVIEHTLQRNDCDKRRTAEQLGIALKTLYNRLNSYRELRDTA